MHITLTMRHLSKKKKATEKGTSSKHLCESDRKEHITEHVLPDLMSMKRLSTEAKWLHLIGHSFAQSVTKHFTLVLAGKRTFSGPPGAQDASNESHECRHILQLIRPC